MPAIQSTIPMTATALPHAIVPTGDVPVESAFEASFSALLAVLPQSVDATVPATASPAGALPAHPASPGLADGRGTGGGKDGKHLPDGNADLADLAAVVAGAILGAAEAASGDASPAPDDGQSILAEVVPSQAAVPVADPVSALVPDPAAPLAAALPAPPTPLAAMDAAKTVARLASAPRPVPVPAAAMATQNDPPRAIASSVAATATATATAPAPAIAVLAGDPHTGHRGQGAATEPERPGARLLALATSSTGLSSAPLTVWAQALLPALRAPSSPALPGQTSVEAAPSVGPALPADLSGAVTGLLAPAAAQMASERSPMDRPPTMHGLAQPSIGEALFGAGPGEELPTQPFERPVTASALSSLPAAAPGIAAPTTHAAPASTPSAHDFAALVDRLVEARAAAQATLASQTVMATVNHAEFGRVSLSFQQDPGGLTVSFANPDPELVRAVQSAAGPVGSGASAGDGGAGAQRQDGQGSGSAQAGQSHGQATAQNQRSSAQQHRDGLSQAPLHGSFGDETTASPPASRDGIFA